MSALENIERQTAEAIALNDFARVLFAHLPDEIEVVDYAKKADAHVFTLGADRTIWHVVTSVPELRMNRTEPMLTALARSKIKNAFTNAQAVAA